MLLWQSAMDKVFLFMHITGAVYCIVQLKGLFSFHLHICHYSCMQLMQLSKLNFGCLANIEELESSTYSNMTFKIHHINQTTTLTIF